VANLVLVFSTVYVVFLWLNTVIISYELLFLLLTELLTLTNLSFLKDRRKFILWAAQESDLAPLSYNEGTYQVQ